MPPSCELYGKSTYFLCVDSYDTLKKTIYQLEKQQHALQTSYHDIEAVHETSALIGDGGQSIDDAFIPLLDAELAKITKFYVTQEKELLDEVSKLEALIERQEETGVEPYTDGYFSNEGDDDDDDDDDDDESRSHSRDVAGRRRRLSLSGARGSQHNNRKSSLAYG
jgi:phosphate transporter